LAIFIDVHLKTDLDPGNIKTRRTKKSTIEPKEGPEHEPEPWRGGGSYFN
jgi:hypothetical protein